MRKDAQANHQKILTAATTLFTQRDVATVSMKDIAAAAGIGPGTLYRNYPSKGALCLALVYDSLQQFLTRSQPSHESPRLDWQNDIAAYLTFREENRALLTAIEADGQINFTQTDLYPQLVAHFTRRLQAAQPTRTPPQLQFQVDMLIAMLKSDSYAFQREARGRTPAQLLTDLTDLILGPENTKEPHN